MSFSRILRSVFERLQEHERRLAGSQWTGKVKQVDAQKHLIRMVLGKDDDGADVLSPWLPVGQVAGALKLHSMPSVGQVVAVRAEGGDLEQGIVEPYHWSDENPSPSQNANEHKLTFGNVTITLVDGSLKFQVGGTTVEVTDGKLEVHTNEFVTHGSSLKHNTKEIGDTHKHGGVVPGGSDTDVPV
ncbi:MAG: hypothetical protein E5X34_13310 [Mesorhizobium sp.]|uniref:phage baseplate assembly protein V n=1 Tax=Mesorhizobium sp. TaxID=1871066 RepID=UPI00121D0D9C|nr:phage baseplate assembly protein V [Mesorhizobium sp.]TIR24027.1 MAG: hypothetical protein E5X34_13310 [Mesorhizobium sp.]